MYKSIGDLCRKKNIRILFDLLLRYGPRCKGDVLIIGEPVAHLMVSQCASR